ncbi:hypothetical protein D9757_009178 [Collybiopsis confluens]|uniref:CHAT domain-containing protein n=1 Tax=Collybiopsis confluens TaxID=2823264 RepID=A0A8H5M279_9AGAR|nr:hypothetical protein D9757_009178 [Collybiopsis confluens]
MSSNTPDEDPANMAPSLRLALQLSLLPSDKFDEVLANLATLPFDIWDDDAAAQANSEVVAQDMNARLARMSPYDKAETALLFLREFQQTKNIRMVDQGIGMMRMAVQGYADAGDAQGKFDALRRIASFFTIRFEHTNDYSSLNEAIQCTREALQLDPKNEDAPELFYTLGQYFSNRFTHLGERDDLAASLDNFMEGLSILPEQDDHAPLYFRQIANCILKASGNPQLQTVFARVKDDLVRGDQASLTPERRARILHRVGVHFVDEFEARGNIQDLSEAVALLQCSTELDPTNVEAKTSYGVSRIISYEQRSSVEDLEAAVATQRSASKMLEQDDERLPAILVNLGNALQVHFEVSGNTTDLDEAVNAHVHALNHLKLKPEFKFNCHYSLAKSYHRRFEHLQDFADLEFAIEGMRMALETIPENHPSEAKILASYGAAYAQLYPATKNMEHLERGIEMMRKAILLTRNDDPARPLRLINLAQTILDPSDVSLESINEAVQYLEEAASALDSRRVEAQSIASFALSGALRRKYVMQKQAAETIKSDLSLDLLDRSVDAGHRALDLLPNMLEMAKFSQGLATSLLFRSRDNEKSSESDRNEAMEILARGSSFPSKPSYNQFLCATQRANLCVEYYGTQSGLEAFKEVFKLIPRIVWIGNDLHSRYDLTKNLWRFLGYAVALAIKADELKLALEWAEEGRCIVWGQILQFRKDEYGGPLGEEIRSVTEKLQKMGMESHHSTASAVLTTQLLEAMTLAVSRDSPIPGMSPEEFARRMAAFAVAVQDMKKQEQRMLAEKYEQLMAQAQSSARDHNALRSQSFTDLSAATRNGPVVFINVSDERCDAIALVPWQKDPLLIPLENFSKEQADQMLASFVADLETKGVRTRSRGGFPTSTVTGRIRALLASLWTDVVRPIIESFGTKLRKAEDGRLPHITWCVSGPLTFLPLHAAGIYKTGGGDKIFDYVVSSYTPNLAALLAAQNHSLSQSKEATQLLAISQPNTPNAEDLPSTTEEVQTLQKMYPNMTWINDSAGKKEAVLEGIRTHNWVHFACHAIQDIENPLKSAFLLQDKDLELADLMTESFSRTQLAYLSACRTAVGHEQLSEEAVHLAAGMLMAGFQNVIGTLWAIDDDDASFVAQHFYRYLREEGDNQSSHSSYALHYAVGKLREKIGQKHFLRWVPFVHFGV